MGISGLPVPEYKTLSQEVFRHLCNAILDGRLRPGERLVEAAIADQMGVSRAPVREAIIGLEKLGLVDNRPRRGTFVVAWNRADVEEISTLRMALEGLAAILAADRITSEECEQMQAILNRMKEGGDGLSLAESVELDLQFHQILWAASKHSRLCAVLHDLRGQMQLFISFTRPTRPPGYLEWLASQHQEILDALRAGEGNRAKQLVTRKVALGGQRMAESFGKGGPEDSKVEGSVPLMGTDMDVADSLA